MIEWQERTNLLLGPEKLEKLHRAHILVVGLGGVGAYAAEMLARSGIGRLTIVDADQVAASNINRQLVALHSTIGKSKAEILAGRLRDINPNILLQVIQDYIRDETTDRLLDGCYDTDYGQNGIGNGGGNNIVPKLETDVVSGVKYHCHDSPGTDTASDDHQGPSHHGGAPETVFPAYDYMVDAIDTLSPKVNLIKGALDRGIPLVSSMGAGAKTDPTLLEISDISKSHHCPLAHMLRKRLHKLGIRTGFKVVFSPEPVREGAMVLAEETNKKSNLGTISYMPAVFGCFCASVVIRDLLGEL